MASIPAADVLHTPAQGLHNANVDADGDSHTPPQYAPSAVQHRGPPELGLRRATSGKGRTSADEQDDGS